MLLLSVLVVWAIQSPPSISITSPTNGSTITADPTISATSNISVNMSVVIINSSGDEVFRNNNTGPVGTTPSISWAATNGSFPDGIYNITIELINSTAVNTTDASTQANGTVSITLSTPNATATTTTTTTTAAQAVSQGTPAASASGVFSHLKVPAPGSNRQGNDILIKNSEGEWVKTTVGLVSMQDGQYIITVDGKEYTIDADNPANVDVDGDGTVDAMVEFIKDRGNNKVTVKVKGADGSSAAPSETSTEQETVEEEAPEATSEEAEESTEAEVEAVEEPAESVTEEVVEAGKVSIPGWTIVAVIGAIIIIGALWFVRKKPQSVQGQ